MSKFGGLDSVDMNSLIVVLKSLYFDTFSKLIILQARLLCKRKPCQRNVLIELLFDGMIAKRGLPIIVSKPLLVHCYAISHMFRWMLVSKTPVE